MNNAYTAYFSSQKHLQEATQYLQQKSYCSAASILSETIDNARCAAEEAALTANAIQTYTTASVLLIAVYIRLNNQFLAQEKQEDASRQLEKWRTTSNSRQVKDLCRYCCQLLVTGCQHSRCVGHYVQQLEELNHAQEQT
ncbi:hypothetical protein AWR38_05240 [Idiomarina sp. WRN-38]|jgi:hypothetical protein|uniref:hypothetical protein n=1 Tax=unclassified Idiomarina TaxID=2614829 RepID=UPI0007336BEE|nr:MULTISPECIES: hypothetical protein [unclassified Idiomarina]KTG23431.1 hypothetical protein AUR68_05225 [Idiomarina sp. H105]OAE90823.1 hypothetical protein AWR38_05240 [Idiomarina sp. WRN-38]MCH2454198.1 hypothetical protein [Idiomarina sp.]MCJ8317960.1 hypothetical protein [Idiomarina sp.]NQZ17614.1 hypothetical protein [Idiomarina sp.]|tara:strand:+ start:2396 stop:2815 length:420 start_codon:yes stop_codon:yes gene_type:complete